MFEFKTIGYCITSYMSRSKGLDCVFVAESSESFRAADREQFYVSVSRFKQALTIYTDDKRQLFEAVSKTSERPSAMDLVAKQISTESEREPGEKQRHDPKIVEVAEPTKKTEQVETLKSNFHRLLARPVQKKSAPSRSQSIGM